MNNKILPPQGTRDFDANTIYKRNYIFNTIRNVFELYGFQPLETPAMEYLDTLMGKYGDEGDKLIFKILNNGLDHSTKQAQARIDFERILEGKSVTSITEKALRYDLTIPFARYVAMHHRELLLPFKRYQIQPVWRADRPQKGRYREFYQCDADIVGSNSLLNEVELASIYIDVMRELGIKNYELRINSRKILAALAEICGVMDNLTDITIAIDKLDKIGLEKVKTELIQKGLNEKQIDIIQQYLFINGSNVEKLNRLTKLIGKIEIGKKGIEELEFILNYKLLTTNSQLIIDFTLARGLNYYTGIIFEVIATDVKIGSIGGGGRYDDLTGLFGVPNISGVGISFGVDRIYDVMEELKLFPAEIYKSTQVLFFNLGQTESTIAFSLMQQLRAKGLRCEMYPEQTKFDKQFKYAAKKNIPYIIIIGEKEIQDKTCTIKNLVTTEQKIIPQQNLLTFHF